MEDKIISDKELGNLVVRVNPRARRLVFRTKSDAIYVSVPPHTPMQEVEQAIEKLRDRLLFTRQKVVCTVIDLNFRIDAEYFKLSLVGGKNNKFLAHSELGTMQIICPANADFGDEGLQQWLQKVIEEALRRNAKIILPLRLYQLAEQHRLPYKSVKINSSRGRWGSCSATKAINLSYFLILLPSHLIDYVLLHELSHTQEMNHGDRFWELLNGLTGGKALELREELKKYKTELK